MTLHPVKSAAKTLLALIVATISLAGLSGCNHKHEENHDQYDYVATSPYLADTTMVKDYVCQISAIQHIELRALEKGYLQKIYVDEGQRIRKGQLMFEIMPVLYEAEQERAQAESKYAEIEYLNTKRLADSNIVAQTEKAMAHAKYKKALAELSLAKAHLTFTQIKAPFDGIMDHFYVRQGSLLNEGDLLTKLSDNSKIWVYFNVPEAEYLDYKIRTRQDSLQTVSLLMANNKLFNHLGKVSTIEADFNNETGNIAFRATFPNPEGLLRHGETGSIRLEVPYPNALIIPQKATFEILEKKYVFVIDSKGIVHSREITIAETLPDLYIVKEGLSPNESILLEGLQKVKEKDKIEFRKITPQAALKSLKVYTE